jgi:WD40 repeat protein
MSFSSLIRFSRALPARIFFCLLTLFAAAVNAAEPTRAVSPQAMAILKGNCFNCHNTEKKKGGLLLTSRAGLFKGGENGPVVTAGNGEKSKLIHFLSPESDPHMPPKKQLSDKQIAVLRSWIDEGAVWNEQALANFGMDTPLEKLGSLPQQYQPVLALALSPDGKALAVARGQSLTRYDLSNTNFTALTPAERHRDAVQSLAWSHNGKLIASGSYRELCIWDANTLKLTRRITNSFISRINAAAFCPDDTLLAVSDGLPTKSGIIRIWQTASWKPATNWEAHRDLIMALEFSHDGKMLASAGADKLAKIFQVVTRPEGPSGKELARFEGHGGHVLALGFSPDDSMLATAGADKVLNFWDTKTREQKITVPKHPAPLTALAWAANGKSLVTASEDGSARIYTDLKSHSGKEQSEGAQMRALSTIDEVLYAIALSADGKTIYGGAHDGTVYIWNSDGKLKRRLEQPKLPSQLARVEVAR